jgi:hypothetical protein
LIKQKIFYLVVRLGEMSGLGLHEYSGRTGATGHLDVPHPARGFHPKLKDQWSTCWEVPLPTVLPWGIRPRTSKNFSMSERYTSGSYLDERLRLISG